MKLRSVTVKMYKPLKRDDGAALVLALLILMVLTLLASVAINVVSGGLTDSGVYRDKQLRLHMADSGTEYGFALIERAIANGTDLDTTDTTATNIALDPTDTNTDGTTDLGDEIKGQDVNNADSYSDATPDATVTILSDIVKIDIDYVKTSQMSGSSSEFSSRYEGIGSGGAGGVGLYYRIDSSHDTTSVSTGTLTTAVDINYKCIEGGGRCL